MTADARAGSGDDPAGPRPSTVGARTRRTLRSVPPAHQRCIPV